jgi:hypothetical protein
MNVNPVSIIATGALEENQDLEANLLGRFWTPVVP